MTNLEAVKVKIANNYPLEDEFFEVALIEAGIVAGDEFVGGKSFDRSMVNLLLSLMASAERISEGGYTVELNIDALQRLLSYYLNKWGWPDPSKPIIRDKSYLW